MHPSCHRAQGFPDRQELGGGVRFAFLEGDPADLTALRKADVGTAAAVVVAGLNERGAKEADALVLTTMLDRLPERHNWYTHGSYCVCYGKCAVLAFF